MNESKYAVILVYSTSHAMRIERLLNGEKIECKLIPVPRKLSSDCGVCVRFEAKEKEIVIQKLNQIGVEYMGIYSI